MKFFRNNTHHPQQIVRLLVCLAMLWSQAAKAATGTHLAGSTLYPRLIRLHHAPRPLRNSLLAKTGNKLYRSLDEGRTFTFLSALPTISEDDQTNSQNAERCCSTIYELPRKIGSYPAGTLLYSGSFFSEGTPAIEIFISSNHGVNWQYLGTPLKAGDKKHGLWEPEFTVAHDKSLVMFVSDETDPCCSQKLVQMRTTDLLHWSARQDTVASASPKDRPGMAVVSRIAKHSYFMSYEVCGPVAHCQVYFHTSADGLNFGPAGDFGTKAVSTTGQYFAHAPASIWDRDLHHLLLVGQMLYQADGTISPQNGALVFVHEGGALSSPWRTQPAPVQVPTAYDNYCPNYSSALMPTRNGLLELASDYDELHHCTSFFDTLAIQSRQP